jgi:beta-lactamase class D
MTMEPEEPHLLKTTVARYGKLDILVLDETTVYRLSGKIGWANQVGWFVGYLETNGTLYYFATNLESEGSEENLGKISQDITSRILVEYEILQ